MEFVRESELVKCSGRLLPWMLGLDCVLWTEWESDSLHCSLQKQLGWKRYYWFRQVRRRSHRRKPLGKRLCEECCLSMQRMSAGTAST